MRNLTVTSCGVLLAMTILSCKSQKTSAYDQTTTTGAEVPVIQRTVPPAPAVEPQMNAAAPKERQSEDGGAPNTQGRVTRPPVTGADETMHPQTRPSSFESSGGSSGLGRGYGREVPGQKNFEVRDGG
jgi:hypothetical protein